MTADPRPGPNAFRPAGKSAKEFLDCVGDELRRADDVLLKLKRGQRGGSVRPLPSRHDAPNADEFLRQLDRAALRLKPDPGPAPTSAIPEHNAVQLPVEHSPHVPSYWRENQDATSLPPVAPALTWSSIPVAPRVCSAVDEDLSSLLLCEDCRRLGVRLLRVAVAASVADAPVRELKGPSRDVSTMVDRLRDMATAVGEMQAALGGEEQRTRRRGEGTAPRLRLARFSET